VSRVPSDDLPAVCQRCGSEAEHLEEDTCGSCGRSQMQCRVCAYTDAFTEHSFCHACAVAIGKDDAHGHE
jgi:hypothetical protein